jgi:protein ImuB
MKILALSANKNHLNILAELAWKYSSQIAVNHYVVFLEIEKSKEIYSPFEILQSIQKACEELTIPLRWAFGKSPAEAWAFLAYKTQFKDALPLEALQIYLDPFHKKEVSPVIPQMVQAFHKLGYKNFADLNKIPRSGVASRFGPAGLWALQLAEDNEEIPWPLWRPKETIEETQTFDPDQRVQSVETLGFILRPLLDRLMARLAWRHEALTQVQLTMHLEPFTVVQEPIRSWDFIFSFPQTQNSSVLQILKEKLDFDLQKKPLESSVIYFEMKVLEKVPLPDRQKDFFSKKEENDEMESALISRLHQKLGRENVFHAFPQESYYPEKAWARNCSTGNVINTSVLPKRPLVLLKKPTPLRKFGSYLIYQNKKHQIKSWQGPEKLASEWWDQFFVRQYWVVEVDNNQRWWVYSDLTKPPSENLFLHGIYD